MASAKDAQKSEGKVEEEGGNPKFLNLVVLLAVAWTFYTMNTPSLDIQEEARVPVYTQDDLKNYDGKSDGPGLLLAVWGRVFNVTSGSNFYAPGQGYEVFAGHECTFAFATASTKAKDLGRTLETLTDKQISHLNQTYWETYVAKYPIVGRLDDSPFDPTDYDKYAGPWRRVRLTSAGGADERPKKASKRQSRCPVTRAAKAIGNAIVSLVPKQLAPPSWSEDESKSEEL
eukprot:CAMPEP_0206428308 /NCGR_PEP_ID=MMETSP0324_2-20121206/5576_1 /ASSEMBLY_ACC=CAM_ASM_000836 /TAXON_ID=2866 /ORGANISM="Crypthecodinium cohnii, Strain Seligo" /LENGTH=229 /DNA_ID=CAMNT_0053893789 /DNA_START=40 /DNA_END=729 /DNA_ORIENTATION=+